MAAIYKFISREQRALQQFEFELEKIEKSSQIETGREHSNVCGLCEGNLEANIKPIVAMCEVGTALGIGGLRRYYTCLECGKVIVEKEVLYFDYYNCSEEESRRRYERWLVETKGKWLDEARDEAQQAERDYFSDLDEEKLFEREEVDQHCSDLAAVVQSLYPHLSQEEADEEWWKDVCESHK